MRGTLLSFEGKEEIEGVPRRSHDGRSEQTFDPDPNGGRERKIEDHVREGFQAR